METYIKIGLLIFLIILLILVCNIQKIKESFTTTSTEVENLGSESIFIQLLPP